MDGWMISAMRWDDDDDEVTGQSPINLHANPMHFI
jgi:hypothetical protein